MSNVGQRNAERKAPGGGRLKAQRIPPPNPQLFDDTSMQGGGYGGYAPQQTADFSVPYGQHGGNDYAPQMGGYGGPPMGGGGPHYGAQGNAGGPFGPGGPPGGGGLAFPGQHLLNDPMANMAMQYGQTLAGQGSEFINQNLEKYKGVATSKLKSYFAVDSAYVGKKLGLVIFPFAHKEWAVRYTGEGPALPRYDVNAPDLYIPVMAFVTYVLLAGVSLGTQNRFSPEQLGLTASSALVSTIIELLLLLLTMYIVNVSTGLKYLDLLAYCGYKYVGMIVVILGGLAFHSTGYYAALAWTSLSIAFFLVRSLKLAIVPHPDAGGVSVPGVPSSFDNGGGSSGGESGAKRRLYLLLFVALTQPLLIWWLTRHLVRSEP